MFQKTWCVDNLVIVRRNYTSLLIFLVYACQRTSKSQLLKKASKSSHFQIWWSTSNIARFESCLQISIINFATFYVEIQQACCEYSEHICVSFLSYLLRHVQKQNVSLFERCVHVFKGVSSYPHPIYIFKKNIDSWFIALSYNISYRAEPRYHTVHPVRSRASLSSTSISILSMQVCPIKENSVVLSNEPRRFMPFNHPRNNSWVRMEAWGECGLTWWSSPRWCCRPGLARRLDQSQRWTFHLALAICFQHTDDICQRSVIRLHPPPA